MSIGFLQCLGGTFCGLELANVGERHLESLRDKQDLGTDVAGRRFPFLTSVWLIAAFHLYGVDAAIVSWVFPDGGGDAVTY